MQEMYKMFNENEIKVVEQMANKGGRSFAQVAESIGISERTLFRLRSKPLIKKAIRERVMEELQDDIPDIVSALRRGMKRDDFRSIELLAKMAGLLVEKREIKTSMSIEDNRFVEMSQDDIDQELRVLENQISEFKDGSS